MPRGDDGDGLAGVEPRVAEGVVTVGEVLVGDGADAARYLTSVKAILEAGEFEVELGL